ncbi:MAG: hypothetical protein DYG92_03920 [Leptolyngbya sp. PLA1]|nr:hypothetical protein [Leptolyngbya sp. PLA1]
MHMKLSRKVCACAGALLATGAYGQTYEIQLVDFGLRPAQAWCVNGSGTSAGGFISTVHNAYRGFVGAGQELAPAPGDTQSMVFALDDAGRAAAVSFTIGDPGERALLVDGAGSTVLGDFCPRGFGPDGRVVGSRVSTFGPGWLGRRACVYTEAGLTDLPSLGGEFSQAMAAGPGDWVVGFSFTATGLTPRATLWSGGVVRDLGTLGGPGAEALGVGAGGRIVGTSETVGGAQRPFLFLVDAGGNVTQRVDLGTLGTGGGNYGAAYGVNSAGHVVGTSADRAFMFRDGVMHDLETLVVNPGHWHLAVASSINDAGHIAGWGVYKGWPAAFVLTPVAACDPDLNGDGNVDQDDVAYLVNVVGGGSNPTGIDPDFNGDGNVDQDDVAALINVVAGGGCP